MSAAAPPIDAWTASVALPVLLATINLLVVCGNVFVLYILISQKALHTATNSIVFSLTLSDFLLGCLILPFSIVQEFTNRWHFGSLWCRSWLSLDILLSTASIYNLLAISFDRYMAVKQPIKYGRLISSSRLSKFTISAVWLISAALALPPLVSDLFLVTASTELEMGILLDTNHSSAAVLFELVNTCTPVTNSDPYILFSATISFILPMILMVGLNVSIFCTVLDSKRKLSQSPFPVRGTSVATGVGKQNQQQKLLTLDTVQVDAAPLRVHRGGSCRTLCKVGGSPMVEPNWHHHHHKANASASSVEKRRHLSFNLLNNNSPPSLDGGGSPHFLRTTNNRKMPTTFVHQQSFPTTAFYASATQHNIAEQQQHQSLPSSRKGTLDTSTALLAIAGGGGGAICGGGRVRGETFSSTSAEESPRSSAGANSLCHGMTTMCAEARKRNVRQIWLKRIKRIKMAQQQQQRKCRRCTAQFCPALVLCSSIGGSCSASTDEHQHQHCSGQLQHHSHLHHNCCSSTSPFSSSSLLINNMRLLVEQERKLRCIAAVQQQRSALERTVDRAVWFPAVVTSLFAAGGVSGGGADGDGACGDVKQSTSSSTICRRQSERLLLYPTIQFAKNSLRTEMRVARTIAVVVGCFTCCWLPFTVIYVLQAFHLCPVGFCIPDWLFSLSFWLGYANSALNPLLYAAFSRDFRMAFRRILMRDRNSSIRGSG